MNVIVKDSVLLFQSLLKQFKNSKPDWAVRTGMLSRFSKGLLYFHSEFNSINN